MLSGEEMDEKELNLKVRSLFIESAERLSRSVTVLSSDTDSFSYHVKCGKILQTDEFCRHSSFIETLVRLLGATLCSLSYYSATFFCRN